jgi:hypothetical protein
MTEDSTRANQVARSRRTLAMAVNTDPQWNCSPDMITWNKFIDQYLLQR